MSSDWEMVRQTFTQVWGYDDFRHPQGEVIANLLQHRDSLVILATGSGKSICFQLPALCQNGLTLVVSPLLALMEDQVQDLKRKKLPAATLHSNLTTIERKRVLQQLPSLRLLYVSPETLLSQPVWERLCDPNLPIAGLMLDEAHCLVQWGETFRPAYRRLGAVRSALMQHKLPSHPPMAIAAFTATADPHTQAELKSCLQLQNPQIIRTSPYRRNLSLHVAIAWTSAGRKDRALKFVRSFQKQSGLIYVRTRRDSEELAEWFQTQGLKTVAYHAGLPSGERRHIEQLWLNGEYLFVICTSAFGMGINKSNVRWILHFHAPLTLSEYIQEVGRAGRDGKLAQALMLVSEPTGILDHSDRQRQQFFLAQQQHLQQKAQRLFSKIPRRGNHAEVIKISPDGAIALGLLHSAGQLTWLNPFEYEIKSGGKPNLDTLEIIDETPLAQMQAYLTTRNCRWAFLL